MINGKDPNIPVTTGEYLNRYWIPSIGGAWGGKTSTFSNLTFLATDLIGKVGAYYHADWTKTAVLGGTSFNIAVAFPIAGLPVSMTGIDGTPQTVTNITPLVVGSSPATNLVTDAQVGINTFTIAVTFSEAMDPTVIPVVSFPVENPVGKLTTNGGTWSAGNTVYTARYIVTDDNALLNDINISVTGGQLVEQSGCGGSIG